MRWKDTGECLASAEASILWGRGGGGSRPPPMKILGGGANISFCPPNNFANLKNS